MCKEISESRINKCDKGKIGGGFKSIEIGNLRVK
jgi:hypothetical protein